MQSIGAKQFLELATHHAVIDVRTPAEYERGHIPGAFNIPLFSNEERAEIGTLYKEHGRESATARGMELVKPKFADFIAAAQKLSASGSSPTAVQDKILLVHCWRGGMRSAGMALLFEWWGFNAFTLSGGYKAFRRMALHAFAEKRNIAVLGGRTGSGKTAILQELASLGALTLNLETLANHKGSAFGSLGEKTQPSQEMFENELAVKLFHIPPAEKLWMEDESQNIGKRIIPTGLFAQMRSAKVVFVEIPFEERVAYLSREYGKYAREELITSVDKIRKRIGPQHAKAAMEAIDGGDIKKACEICLLYYDKSYDHGLAKRQRSSVTKKAYPTIEPRHIANEIINKP